MSAEYAILKLAYMDHDIEDLSIQEWKEIEDEHGRYWHKNVGGINQNPLYNKSPDHKFVNRITPW